MIPSPKVFNITDHAQEISVTVGELLPYEVADTIPLWNAIKEVEYQLALRLGGAIWNSSMYNPAEDGFMWVIMVEDTYQVLVDKFG